MSTRTELEKELYEFLDDMDPSGKNTQRMKAFLSPMEDRAFYKYMVGFLSDPDKYIQVGYEAFDNPVTVQFIEKVAKKHNVPLYETVYKPFLNYDKENPPATVTPVLVVDIPIKRLKQTVTAKSHTSITNTKRDAKTGQVTGSDKTARVTDVESYSLIAQELYQVAQEEYGPLADDEAAMSAMLRDIQQAGEFYLSELPNDPLNKRTMGTIYIYSLGAGIVTNLIEESGYVLPNTLQSKETNKKEIKR